MFEILRTNWASRRKYLINTDSDAIGILHHPAGHAVAQYCRVLNMSTVMCVTVMADETNPHRHGEHISKE